MLKKVLQVCVVSAFCWSLASAYEIVIDSTYYIDGRDDSKQVVYDPQTSLMWQDDESAKSVEEEWQGAIEHCQNLNLAGHNDWRLPGHKELYSIVDENNKPIKIKSEFKNTVSSIYWTSTTNWTDARQAWGVYFTTANTTTVILGRSKTNSNYVRCVRSVQ